MVDEEALGMELMDDVFSPLNVKIPQGNQVMSPLLQNTHCCLFLFSSEDTTL